MDDSQGAEGGGVDLAALQTKFSLEFTRLYLQIARSACLQTNYAVTTKYLQLTEAAITEVRCHFKSLLRELQLVLH